MNSNLKSAIGGFILSFVICAVVGHYHFESIQAQNKDLKEQLVLTINKPVYSYDGVDFYALHRKECPDIQTDVQGNFPVTLNEEWVMVQGFEFVGKWNATKTLFTDDRFGFTVNPDNGSLNIYWWDNTKWSFSD
jgi:hypothetical protein